MLRRFGIAAASLIVGWASPAGAQAPPASSEKLMVGDFTLYPKAEVRVRGEYRHDPSDLGGIDFFGRETSRVRDAWGVFERSRLGLGAERGMIRAQFTLQDARALGTPGSDATFAGRTLGQFGPYEAFVEIHGQTARPTFLRIGRQEVQWGEGRLIGNADFAHTGRSLDAARVHYAKDDVDVEALAVLLESPGPLGAGANDSAGPARSGVQLYGITGKWSAAPMLRVEVFAIARMARSTSPLDGSRFALARLSGETYTGSLRFSGESRGWDYGVEGAYQLGTADALALDGKAIAAWAAYAHVAKRLDQLALSPTVHVAGSYASGDDDSGGAYKQFDPLLADPQRFHGQTDLFGWSNMIDFGGGVNVAPWNQTTLGVDYRYARLAEASGEWVNGYERAIGQSQGRQGGSAAATGFVPQAHGLGHELAATFAWHPWSPFELRAGYSLLFLGDAARDIMSAHRRGTVEPDLSVKTPTMTQFAFLQAKVSID